MLSLLPYKNTSPVTSNITKMALLALLYVITGKLGLMLAVPPGYATVIWPPSGIAIGMLLLHGWRLWPGVFIGSFVLNCYISTAYTVETGWVVDKVIIAAIIAAGSTAQALFGRWLVSRVLGLPLRLSHIRDVFSLFVLAGPVACLIAATVGVGTLNYFGAVPADKFISNWTTWWAGDAFGVLVFLPLVLIAPGSRDRLTWRGHAFGTLPILAMLTLMLPLGITFYAWKIASENMYSSSHEKFKALAQESEKALLHRMDSYNQALLGGAGFFLGSSYVSRDEWRTYVDIINLAKEYPGIKGIGYIEDVRPEMLETFLKKTRADAPHFNIHPDVTDSTYYVIKYIEPETANRQALGLNIAFEKHRREAADLSRDSGRPAITKRVLLVQEQTPSPGFLLLNPIYTRGMPVNTPEERRLAHRGWMYAPFVSKDFMHALTKSQDHTLNLRVYDGDTESEDALIFSSESSKAGHNASVHTVRKKLEIMQQQWTVVWTSTKVYEQQEQSSEPIFLLIAGLFLTGALGLFLLLSASRGDTILWLVEEKAYALPLSIFLLIVIGAYYLQGELFAREENYIARLVEEKSKKIEARLATQASDKFAALKRMAERWETAKGTPEAFWRQDAKRYIQDLAGLTTVEWIDKTYHVRWVEPYKGNEKALGLNILFNKEREEALKGASLSDAVTITQPIDLVQGYKAFIAYAPIHVDGAFEGFITGIFGIDQYLQAALSNELLDRYGIKLSYQGKEFYSAGEQEGLVWKYGITKTLQIYDKKWLLELAPTHSFINNNFSPLPNIVFIAGLIIALLAALSVRYILIARVSNMRLRASEGRYDLAVRGMSVGLWDWNVETNALYWSEKFKRILGVSDKDFIPHYSEFEGRLHPEDKERTIAMLFGHLEGKNLYNVEYRLRHNDGHYVWIHAFGQAEWDASGKPLRMAGSVNDITERKALENEQAKLIAVIEESTDFIGMADLEGNLLYHNRSAKRMVGLSDDFDISGLKISDMHPKWACKLVLEQGIPAVHKHGYWRGETALLNQQTGEEIPVLQTLNLHRDAQGNPVCLTTIMRDISERKEQERALQSSEETFRLAMDNASIGMALVGLDGKWIKVNPALCGLLGYTSAELLKTDFQTITHPDDLKTDLENVRRLLAGEINNYQMEKRYFHKNGHLIWTTLAVSLVHNDDGSPKYFVSQIQDITERREIDRMKSEFISTVSHELRTPLTSIRGSLGLLEGGAAGNLPPKAQNLVQIAHKNSQRLVRIINDILDVEKIESGKLQVNIRALPLRVFLQQAIEANQAYGERFDVRLRLESALDTDVMADPDRLMQVMANLLSNAIKFSPEGDEVTIRARREQQGIRVEVEDKGQGIPEEFRARIFGKFAQADSSDTRRHEGTGLGLSIAKQLVELMGGDIGFTTATGKGTTFHFHIPEAERKTTLLSDQSCYRILICEDDDTITAFMQAILEQGGYLVETAHNVQEAKAKLQSGYYSALILDIILPLADGLEFLKALRKQERTRELPVLIVSAKAKDSAVINNKTLNISEWITKPIDSKLLLKAVQAAMTDGEGRLPYVLHIEDDQDLTRVLAEALQGKAMVVSAPTLAIAKHHLENHQFDLVLLDVGMPDSPGTDILPALKERALPVIVLSANEVPVNVQEEAVASLVKSRVSETQIINTILAHLPYTGIDRRKRRPA